MKSIGRHRLLAITGTVALLVLTGCSVTEVNPAYKPKEAVERVRQDTAKLTIGSFADRRGTEPEWLGEIRGKYIYPKAVLETRDPVSTIVRDMVIRGAKARLMLAEDVDGSHGYENGAEVYQLYGQVTKLSGSAQDKADAEVRAHLVTRLINVADNDEVYTATHRVDFPNVDIHGSPVLLGNFVEEALNEVVQKLLDDPEFRKALQSGDTDS